MIDTEQQQNLLLDIAKELKEKISAFAIGGTAMMLLGLKRQTLDIDLVFLSRKEREKFIFAAKSLGYSEMDSKIVYGAKNNKPLMIKLSDARLDLFVNEIITSKFSEAMQKRAEKVRQFDDNLIIKIADVNDLVVMKCVTEREKDISDILELLKSREINWNVIIEEAKNQIMLGNERAVLDIGTTFEKLNNKYSAQIPQSVLENLWEILKNQIDKKIDKGKEDK